MSRNALTFSFLLLFAGFAGVYILIQKNRHDEQLKVERAESAEWERRLENAANTNAELRDKAEATAAQETRARRQAELTAQIEAEARQQADEARRMAEEKVREEEEKRRRRIAEMSERLEREAEERKLAEAALANLDEVIRDLELVQERSEEKLQMLAETREQTSDETTTDYDNALESAHAQLAAKEAEIRRLASEQQKLKRAYRNSLARESQTTEAIVREAAGDGKNKNLIEIIGGVLVKVGLLPESKKKADLEARSEPDMNVEE